MKKGEQKVANCRNATAKISAEAQLLEVHAGCSAKWLAHSQERLRRKVYRPPREVGSNVHPAQQRSYVTASSDASYCCSFMETLFVSLTKAC